jgi:hypothetical protein
MEGVAAINETAAAVQVQIMARMGMEDMMGITLAA